MFGKGDIIMTKKNAFIQIESSNPEWDEATNMQFKEIQEILENADYLMTVLDAVPGEDVGLQSCLLFIQGEKAYSFPENPHVTVKITPQQVGRTLNPIEINHFFNIIKSPDERTKVMHKKSGNSCKVYFDSDIQLVMDFLLSAYEPT